LTCLERFFDLLKEINFFIAENKNVEEWNDRVCLSDIAFLVDVTSFDFS